MDAADRKAVEGQLGREVRGEVSVAHRCACGLPDTLQNPPRLPDGTPFPTLYYLTCPRLTSAIGTLEASGVMKDLEERLAGDEELAAQYQAAHDLYLAERGALGEVAEIAGISAGGMPNRVKCLHVLVAHSLAKGPGVNPLGDITLEMLPDWAARGKCQEDC